MQICCFAPSLASFLQNWHCCCRLKETELHLRNIIVVYWWNHVLIYWHKLSHPFLNLDATNVFENVPEADISQDLCYSQSMFVTVFWVLTMLVNSILGMLHNESFQNNVVSSSITNATDK